MISIIVPTLNPNLSKIFETLENILQNKEALDVVVVFQGTDSQKICECKKRFESESRITFLQDDQMGVSRARNLGLTRAKYDWFLFFDDDVLVESNCLQELCNFLPTAQYKFYFGNLYQIGTKKNYLKYAISKRTLGNFSYNRVCSAMLLVHRQVIKSVGNFDPCLGIGSYCGSGEESDLILRALNQNFCIQYLDLLTVYHAPPQHDLATIKSYIRGHGAIFKKYFLQGNWYLSIKLLLDLFLRIILLFEFKIKRFIYFYSFYIGYKSYKKENRVPFLN